MSSQSTPGPSKRAIPRLAPHQQAALRYGVNSRQRVSRACLSCRTRKVKCDGEQPTCKGCRDQSTSCVYVVTRKDKLRDATRYNQRMAGLLRELRVHVEWEKQHEIDELLDQVTESSADASTPTESLARPTPADFGNERRDDARSAEVGSDNDVDSIDQALLDSDTPPAIGYIGRNSDIHLMRRLHHQGMSVEEAMSRKSSDESVTQKQTSNYNFYLDDENVELDMFADPLQLPPYEVAKRLLDSYMDTVQNTFPILDKAKLIAEFSHFYASMSSTAPVLVSEKTHAIWNLIFAIGAIYSRLVLPEWPAAARDHLVYHSRAWTLMQRGPWWCSHPDLPQVQLTGLLSLYYLAIGRVNRSWLLSGMAMRSGYALGLHRRNSDPTVPAVEKEIRARVWWGVYSLETILCTITGRPSAGLEHHCSVSLPLPLAVEGLEEAHILSQHGKLRLRRHSSSGPTTELTSERKFPESSTQVHEPNNCGSYLKSTVRINIITAAALTQLYCASPVTRPREAVQTCISQLLGRIERCVSTLPSGMNFNTPSSTAVFSHERTSLALHYYSTVILISRPCLVRLDRQTSPRTQTEDEFNKKTAQVCICAAKAIADLLPSHADQDVIRAWYQTPWWSMVHFIMQAAATLLLGLYYVTIEASPDREEMIASLKKLIRGLRVMGLTNASAKRAYTIAFNVFQTLATTVSVPYAVSRRMLLVAFKSSSHKDISDLQAEAAAHHRSQPPHQEQTPNLQQQDWTNNTLPSNMYSLGGFDADVDYLGWEQNAADQRYPGFLPQTSLRNTFPNPFATAYDDQNIVLSAAAGTLMTDYFDADSSPNFPPL